jgi:hypothetical protein
MRSAKKNFLLIITLINLFMSQTAWAQGDNNQLFEDGTQDLIIVLASGAFGAVLGLSTLSFVEQPEKHLKSIVVGGAIGIIFGVATVAYIQANKSKQMYLGDFHYQPDPAQFDTVARNAWHQDFAPFERPQITSGPFLNHTFTF